MCKRFYEIKSKKIFPPQKKKKKNEVRFGKDYKNQKGRGVKKEITKKKGDCFKYKTKGRAFNKKMFYIKRRLFERPPYKKVNSIQIFFFLFYEIFKKKKKNQL